MHRKFPSCSQEHQFPSQDSNITQQEAFAQIRDDT